MLPLLTWGSSRRLYAVGCGSRRAGDQNSHRAESTGTGTRGTRSATGAAAQDGDVIKGAHPSIRIARLASVPVVLFAVLAAVFFLGLEGDDPSVVPSALIGQKVPAFELPPLEGTALPGLASADLARSKVTLVNVFASWCGPCRLEHPVLMSLSKRGDIRSCRHQLQG